MGDPKSLQIDVLAKQILSRYYNSIGILFQESRNKETGQPEAKKEPFTLYINHYENAQLNPLQDITDVILSTVEKPSAVIICNSKLRASFSFKILLLIKYLNVAAPTLLVLPNDIGIRCMTHVDLTQPQYSNYEHLTEMLKVDGENFVYTVDIPLSKFNRLLTREQLNDPTLQASVLLKHTNWTVDTEGIRDGGTVMLSSDATAVSLNITQDILARIGIERDISFECTPNDSMDLREY